MMGFLSKMHKLSQAAHRTGGISKATVPTSGVKVGGPSKPSAKETAPTTGGPAQASKRRAPSVSRPLPAVGARSPMQTGGNSPALPTAGSRSGVGRLQQFNRGLIDAPFLRQPIRDKRTVK